MEEKDKTLVCYGTKYAHSGITLTVRVAKNVLRIHSTGCTKHQDCTNKNDLVFYAHKNNLLSASVRVYDGRENGFASVIDLDFDKCFVKMVSPMTVEEVEQNLFFLLADP